MMKNKKGKPNKNVRKGYCTEPKQKKQSWKHNFKRYKCKETKNYRMEIEEMKEEHL